MSRPAAEAFAAVDRTPGIRVVVPILGFTQILAWGTSYYLLAVLADPISSDTGWPLAGVVSGPIATLTLFGGLASTVCWPLSAILVSEFGWRGACLIYAGIHLTILLPLYAFALPTESQPGKTIAAQHPQKAVNDRSPQDPVPAGSMMLFLLLAAAITVSSVISTVVSVHLLTLLQARNVALAAAISLGTLIGPSQVGARAIEMLISRYHHPIWTMVASTLFAAIGVGALWAGLPIISACLVFYGAGIGLESIARGTLPLALFGEHRYPAIMGRIAMPSLIAQAASPSAGALLMQRFGASGTLAALFATAVVDVLLVTLMFAFLPRRAASWSA